MPALDRPYWIEARLERREGWDETAYPFNLPVVRTSPPEPPTRPCTASSDRSAQR